MPDKGVNLLLNYLAHILPKIQRKREIGLSQIPIPK
jgi:hypothetical protein